VFHCHGLELFDVEELSTHGGSLRLYLQHQGEQRPIDSRVASLREKERVFGLGELPTYLGFDTRVRQLKETILSFFTAARTAQKKVIGYGAPAKGNTLLNYCGITPAFLPFTVDISPHKQGYILPGSHIPIFSPRKIEEWQPDYLFVLP